MKRRVPIARPARERVLKGNPSKKPTREPPAPSKEDVPSCPAWLSAEVKEEWNRVALELARRGLLTKLDSTALACYCVSCARWRKANEIIRTQGEVYVTPKGYLQPRPEVAIARMAAEMMRTLAVEFGMTPVSRARIGVAPAGEDNDPMAVSLREVKRERRGGRR